MATITVTNLNDTGAGSLRNALAIAELQAGADTIVFAAALTGKTIVLTSGPLAIAAGAGAVTVDGDRNNDGVADITLSGNNASSILTVASGANATVDGVVFTAGFQRLFDDGADAAGAVRNEGILAIKNSVVTGNWAIGARGAQGTPGAGGGTGGDAATIVNTGALTVTATRFEGNAATGGEGGRGGIGNLASAYDGQTGGRGGHAAGGILNDLGATLTVSGVAFVNNHADGGKGGYGGNGTTSFYGDIGPGGFGGVGGGASFGIVALPSTVSGTATVSGGGGNGGDGGNGGLSSSGMSSPFAKGATGHSGPLMLALGEGVGQIATTGFRGAQTIYGNNYASTLTGGIGPDQIFGGTGADRITGSDSDFLSGGSGKDTIVVTHISQATYARGGVLGSDFDILDLSQAQAVTGVYDLNASFFTTSAGGRFVNFRGVIGSAGDETIIGLGGYIETLNGGDGNDTLDARNSPDHLIGGLGNDIFLNAASADIVEAANGGNDTIVATASVDLASYPNVENVTFTGAGDLDANGNGFANRLTGNDGINDLFGLGGNDTLAGLGGNDTMTGGDGNDVYVNPEAGDTIQEDAGAAGGEHDRIQTLSSFNISTVANVEDITLVGGANVNAIGNNLANILIGNAGNNTINGGGGADTITGGAGNDTMNGGAAADLFKFATSGAGADTIAGFEKTLDHFNLSGGTFSARTESGGNTTLTHNGGTILVTGVIGLSLTQWKALIVTTGREAEAGPHIAAPWHDDSPQPLGHFGASDFLFA